METGKKYYIRGNIGGISGSYISPTVSPSNLELVVPFQTVRLAAKDQNGQEVSGGEILVYKISGSQGSSSSLAFPQGAKVSIRGRANGYTGSWKAYTMKPDTNEISISFQTVQLTAKDQNGQEVSGAAILVYQISGSQGSNSSLAFPQGANVSIRGRANGYTGSWKAYTMNPDTNEIIVLVEII